MELSTIWNITCVVLAFAFIIFIHELGHFFFESNINIANKLNERRKAGETLTDAEKQLLKDVDALLAQANLDLDTWNIMTLEQRRPHHEYVARQFEAYMMEGKAPHDRRGSGD